MERRHVMFGMVAASLLPVASQAFAQVKASRKRNSKP